jgi:hypothetical protein
MTTRTIILLSILISLPLGCKSTVDQKMADKQLRDNISGDWEIIIEKKNSRNNIPPSPFLIRRPQGMTITSDSIEFYLGFFKNEKDSLTGERTKLYLGNLVPYKTNNDSIIIKNPLTENWEFKWRFVSRINDTLQLAINDTTFIRYKKRSYNLDTLMDFDQIIYSSSGCYGSCPIIDISISKEGAVLFQGDGYVKSLGFYSGRLGTKQKNYIFNKFRQANPLKLRDNYAVGHTDDQTLTTTYTVSGQRQNSLTLLSLGLFWVASFLTQLKFFVPMEFLGFVPHSFTTNTAMGTNILDMCIIKSKIPLLETRSLRIKRVSSFPRFVRIMYPLPSCFHKRKMCNSVEIPGNIPRSKSSC